MLVKNEGIVIRTIDYGEGNKIITLFSLEAGKISLLARGAKKTKSRLAAVSQLFTHGIYMYQASSGSNSIGVLSQGEVINSFANIRQDIWKTAYAAYAVELLGKVLEEKEPNHFMYKLLLYVLLYLDQGIDGEALLRILEFNVLEYAGFRPNIYNCVHCNNKEIVALSVRLGGGLCQDCLKYDQEAILVKPTIFKILRQFSQLDLARLTKISLKEETKKELESVLEKYIAEYLPIQLKSKQFLQDMKAVF